MFEVNDYVKGISDRYGITDKKMTKGIVREVNGSMIRITVLEHEDNANGTYDVDADCFEKIGHAEEFNREKFLELLKESKAKAAEYLSDADLKRERREHGEINEKRADNSKRCGEGSMQS